MNTTLRNIIISSIAIAFAGSANAQAPNKITDVKSAIQSGNYASALAKSLTILKNEPKNFQAAYYAAMAELGLNQFAAAKAHAETALSLAPESSKQTVQTLLDLIESTKAGQSAASEADVAFNANEFGKAASLYEKAYFASPSTPSLGTKAAKIFEEKLGSQIRAASIYRNIIEKTPTRPEAEMARNRLDAMEGDLITISTQKVGAAIQSNNEIEYAKLLNDAEIANPKNVSIFKTRLEKAAKAKNANEVIANLKRIQALSGLDKKYISNIPNIDFFVDDIGFKTSLIDIIGDENYQEAEKIFPKQVEMNITKNIPSIKDVIQRRFPGQYGKLRYNRAVIAPDMNFACLEITAHTGERDQYTLGYLVRKKQDGNFAEAFDSSYANPNDSKVDQLSKFWNTEITKGVKCNEYIDITDRIRQ